MIFIALAVLAVGSYVFVTRPQVFYSRSIVRVSETMAPANSTKDYANARVKIAIRDLTLPDMLVRTASRLGVSSGADDLYRHYIFETRIQPASLLDIRIEVRAHSREWAQKWGEALVSEYHLFREERRNRDRTEAIKAGAREMKEVSELIERSAGKKTDFSTEQGLAKADLELNQIRSLPEKLAGIEKRIGEMRNTRARLRDPNLAVLEKLKVLAPKQDDPSSPTPAPWESLVQEQVSLKALLTDLSRIPIPDQAKVEALRSEIETRERELERHLATATRRFDDEYEVLVDQENSIAARQPSNQASDTRESGSINWPELDRKMARMKKTLASEIEQDTIELTYVGLQEVPEKPVSPDIVTFSIATVLAAAFLAIGVPWLLERSGRTLDRIEVSERILKKPCLGLLPELGARLITHRDKDTWAALNDDVQALASRLLSHDDDQVIAITSAMPSEGKTTIASQVAIAFAQTGTRTLLIDGDLLRGRLHRFFGFRKAQGFGDILFGDASPDEAVRSTSESHLFVLTAATKAIHPGRPFPAEKVSELLGKLRADFDRIIIDSPPILGLAHAPAIAKCSDAVVLVVQSCKTQVRPIKAALNALQTSGAILHGFILNRLAN